MCFGERAFGLRAGPLVILHQQRVCLDLAMNQWIFWKRQLRFIIWAGSMFIPLRREGCHVLSCHVECLSDV